KVYKFIIFHHLPPSAEHSKTSRLSTSTNPVAQLKTSSHLKKLAVYNKMQESLEVSLPSKQEEDEKDQPAEMEYLNSRCVLFTYFQGDIGAVVDEHFSRALSQASSFNSETALSKSKAGLNPLWRGKRGRNSLSDQGSPQRPHAHSKLSSVSLGMFRGCGHVSSLWPQTYPVVFPCPPLWFHSHPQRALSAFHGTVDIVPSFGFDTGQLSLPSAERPWSHSS
uniref:Vestigial like family member 3 n=1 Tax=Zonotrichia albicollis TaxID=44394 RepID=A0A8D2N7L4_ZONAL